MVATLPMKDEVVDVDGVEAFRQVHHVNRVMSSRKGGSCGLIHKKTLLGGMQIPFLDGIFF